MANTDASLTQDEYEVLVERTHAANERYHNEPDQPPLMTDAEYDLAFDQMLAWEESTGFVHDQSVTKLVGAPATLAKVKHTVPMLSLAKATEPEELAKFVERVLKVDPEAELIVEPKYDGASLSLRYVQGILVQAITRGDGEQGDDVTANAKLIRGIPHVITGQGGWNGVIRGEVVITRDDFTIVNHAGQFANARNAAAGALRHSNPREARRRRLSFLAYDNATGDALDIPQDFDMAHTFAYKLDGSEEHPLQAFVDSVSRSRPDLPFETDGVVIKVLARATRDEMGFRTRTPNWAIAWKTTGELVETTLRGVTWQTGAGGDVTPVAELEPVQCMGVEISRASLHNIQVIRELGIKVGDRVMVTRANDTIPQVVEIAEGGMAKGPRHSIEVPKACPVCSEKLIPAGERGQVACPSYDCPAQLAGRLAIWGSREAAKIDGLGDDIIEKLVAEGLVSNVSDFYTLEPLHFERIGRTPEFAAKMFETIQESIHVGMRKAIIGLSISNVGPGTAKRLCEHYESVEDALGASYEDLVAIKDIGDIVAKSINHWYDDFGLNGMVLLSELRDAEVNLDRLPEDAPKEVTADTKRFVLTGSIEGYKSRKEFAKLLVAQGWLEQSSVNKETDFLVTDDTKQSAKMKKALDLGVEVISSARALELATLVAA